VKFFPLLIKPHEVYFWQGLVEFRNDERGFHTSTEIVGGIFIMFPFLSGGRSKSQQKEAPW
jgi:hypothetical protein